MWCISATEQQQSSGCVLPLTEAAAPFYFVTAPVIWRPPQQIGQNRSLAWHRSTTDKFSTEQSRELWRMGSYRNKMKHTVNFQNKKQCVYVAPRLNLSLPQDLFSLTTLSGGGVLSCSPKMQPVVGLDSQWSMKRSRMHTHPVEFQGYINMSAGKTCIKLDTLGYCTANAVQADRLGIPWHCELYIIENATGAF